jgi:hypothetical protein
VVWLRCGGDQTVVAWLLSDVCFSSALDWRLGVGWVLAENGIRKYRSGCDEQRKVKMLRAGRSVAMIVLKSGPGLGLGTDLF